MIVDPTHLSPVFGWSVLEDGSTVLGTIAGELVTSIRAKITRHGPGEYLWAIYHRDGSALVGDEARDFGAAWCAANQQIHSLLKIEAFNPRGGS